MRPTYRKIYGYRDPNSTVREVPERDPLFECIAFDLGQQPVADAITRMMNSREFLMAVVDRIAGLPGLFGDISLSEAWRIYKKSPRGRQPVTKTAIDRVFGLTKSGEQAQLQNVLDKVRKHL